MMARTSLIELREEMRGVAGGTRRASPLPVAPLLAALSPEAMELLGVLLSKRPATVAGLVKLTGRAQPNISRSLQMLAKCGLVRLVREGREVRPVPAASEVRVDLATGTYETIALPTEGGRLGRTAVRGAARTRKVLRN
jgi:DNA-binding transcriptional ArsR family regulator